MKQQHSRFSLSIKSGLISLCITLANVVNAQTLAGCELVSDSPSLTTTIPRLQGYLKSKNFVALEEEWNDKLSRVGQPGYPDFLLYKEIQRVVSDDASLEPLIEQWKSDRPNSFLAYLSSGIFRDLLGYKKRGTGLARETSKEQFEAMAAEHRKGLKDLDVAVSLNKSSAIPMAAMINILRSNASADVDALIFLKAEQADKNNLSARIARIKSISPAWGGSNEMLDSYYKEVGTIGIAESAVRYLQYSILIQKAFLYDVLSKERRKAIETWKQATGLCQYAEEPLRATIRLAYDLEDWIDVRDTASKLLVVLPGNAQVHSQRGWAHEKLTNYAEMERDYLRASELGLAYAQNRIGYFYMTGQYVNKDFVKARKYLQMAVNTGNSHAVENLRWLNQHGDKK